MLAIFLVNIKGMTMPLPYYVNPWAWDSPLDQAIALGQRILIDDKWRTVFAGLFGAGLAILADRHPGRSGLRLLQRRMAWLLVFGLCHLLLVWSGDILTAYALTGFLAVPMVSLDQRALGRSALLLLAGGGVWTTAFMWSAFLDPTVFAAAEAALWDPGSRSAREEIAAFSGGIQPQFEARAGNAIALLLLYLVAGGQMCLLLGIMAGGMWLVRGGLFADGVAGPGALRIGVMCLCGAFFLDLLQLGWLWGSDHRFGVYLGLAPVAAVDGLMGGLGYALCVAALAARIPFAPRWEAAGRMAFTVYITCSIVGTTLAGGHAAALFGKLPLWVLTGVGALTSVLALIVAPWWLSRHRQGPIEAFWRRRIYSGQTGLDQ